LILKQNNEFIKPPLFLKNAEYSQSKLFKISATEYISTNNLYNGATINQDTFLIYTGKGVTMFNEEGFIDHYDDNFDLNGNRFIYKNNLYKTHKPTGEILRYTLHDRYIHHLYDKKLKDNAAYPVYENVTDETYFVISDTLYKLIDESGIIKFLALPIDIPKNVRIKSLYIANDGTYYLGSSNHGLLVYKKKYFFQSEIDPNSEDNSAYRQFVLANDTIYTTKNLTIYENKSIHRKISSLKSLYKWAIRKNLLSFDPIEKLVRPKLKKRLAGIVQAGEMSHVLETLNSNDESEFPSLRDDLVVSLLYHCGIRRAEIIDLVLNNINLSSKILKVKGKGSKERMIPFGDELLSKLLRYINKRKDLKYREGDYLILTNTGSKSYPKLIHRIVEKSLIGKTTIEQKSPHSIRHSFATHLADAGAEMNAIKSLMGHASLASTQFYTHLSVEKLKESYKAAHPSANL